MILKTIEVSLSKEERRIVDEYGNSASTWARIGITAELEDGDLPENCIKLLKAEIQPQVDDWLLRQGGYMMAPGETIEEVEERLGELFGTEVKVSEVSPAKWPEDEVARRGQANGDADDDDIPL